MTEICFIVAHPRNPDTGVPTPVRLAGGGSDTSYYRGDQHYRAGVITMPRFRVAFGFDDNGWTGGTVPQSGELAFAPADDSLLAELAGYYWRDAAIAIDGGDEHGVLARRLTGTVAAASFADGRMILTISDPSKMLDKPLLGTGFAGTGGIEGPEEASGRPKRRSFGLVFNIEGGLIDKVHNIFEFGDPAHPLHRFDAVRDKGRAGAIVELAWQGSVTATFAALQAAAAPEGGGVAAPSIACVKWWTVPAGPLTADIRGETAGGYTEVAATIAARLLTIADGPAIANLVAAAALRPATCGVHIAAPTDTIAQAIDRLLLGMSLYWVLQPDGQVRIGEWAWVAPIETVQASFIGRERQLQPVKSRAVGYRLNHRPHQRSEISAAVILANDVTYLDGESLESLKPAEPGATDGATIGENVKDGAGEVVPREDIITSEGTSKDTNAVGGHPAPALLEDVTQAKQDITNLFSGYGTIGEAIGVANGARDAAVEAAGEAGGHATVATQKRNEAEGFASSAQASAVTAALASAGRGLTKNGAFDEGGLGWVNAYAVNSDYSTPTDMTPQASYRGASDVLINTASVRKDFRGSVASVNTSRKYRLRGRYYVNSTCAIIAGVAMFDAAGVRQTLNHMINDMATVGVWTEINFLIPANVIDDGTQIAPYAITNYTGGGSPAASEFAWDYLYIEDVTESEQSGIHAAAASASAASASQSESSAASSESLTAGYSQAALKRVIASSPSTFEQDGTFFSYLTGSETTASSVEGAYGSPTISYPSTAYGKVLRVTNAAGYIHASQRRRMNLNALKGRTFRIKAKVRMVTPPASGVCSVYIGTYGLTEDFSTIVYGGFFSTSAPTPGMNGYVLPMPTVGEYEVGLDAVVTTGEFSPDGNGRTAVWSSFGVYLFNSSGSGNPTGVVDILSISVEDITESKRAETQATISANQAASATAAASAVSADKTLVANYRADTIRTNGNFGFNLGMENWFTQVDGVSGPIASTGKHIVDTSVLAPSLRTNPNTLAQFFSGTLIPVDTSRKYRMRSRLHAWSPAGSGNASIYVGFVGCDANGAVLDHGSYGSYRYSIWTGNNVAHGATVSPSVIVTGEGNDSWLKFPPGTKFIRPMAIMNYYSANIYTWIDGIFIEDVTESENASTQAGIATQQAAIATAEAAAAKSSNVLTASIAKGYLNPNANFAAWSNWDNNAYPNNYPNGGWYYWNYLGGNTFLRGDVAASLGHAVLPEGSPYFYRSQVSASQETGLMSTPELPTGAGTFIFEATVQLISGGYGGSGLLIYFFDGADSYQGGDYLPFASHPDIDGVVSASKTGLRRFSKSFKTPYANTAKIRIYAMSNYSAGMGAMQAKDIAWLKCGVKPAGATEARVEVNSGAIATLEESAAYHETIVGAGGGNSAIVRLKAGKNGSQVDLAGQRVVIYNPNNASQYAEVARFENGEARLNNALIRKLQVAPREDSQIYFPVQLRPRVYLGTDGQTIQYDGGRTLGAIPDRIVPDLSGIAVGAGEALDVKAINISPTQFTVRAKKITPSAPAVQNSGNGPYVGGIPGWQANKPSVADAYNGWYSFQFDVTLALDFWEPEPPDRYLAHYRGRVTFYANSGSGWVQISQEDLWVSHSVYGVPPETMAFYDRTHAVNYSGAIGQHGGYEFGIHPSLGASNLSFDHVSYTTQTQGSESALTQSIPFYVHPSVG